MDEYNTYNNYDIPPVNSEPPQMPQSNALVTASLVLGICSLVFICCGGGMILGAIGIILALLSRGSGKMHSQAKVGMGLSIGAFSLTIAFSVIYLTAILLSGSFAKAFNEYYSDPYYRDYFDYFDNHSGDDDYNYDYDYLFPTETPDSGQSL